MEFLEFCKSLDNAQQFIVIEVHNKGYSFGIQSQRMEDSKSRNCIFLGFEKGVKGYSFGIQSQRKT